MALVHLWTGTEVNMTVTGQPVRTSEDYQNGLLSLTIAEVTACNCVYCDESLIFNEASDSKVADCAIWPDHECPNLPGPEEDPHWVEMDESNATNMNQR